MMTSVGYELPRIGVVIPHFQREPGLLHRALSSIAAQEYPPVQVVIVDDGSPRAAAEEITATLRSGLPGLTVIRQENKGVAAARNAALDAMTEEVSAIAFLDSDDYWEPAHLQLAAVALSRGADFFFSNLRIEGTTTDLFRQQARRDLLDNPRPVPDAPGIMLWAGSVSALLAVNCPVRTSGVAFRRAVMPQVRFPVRLRGAAGGEDDIAWWELLVRSSVIMYCTEPTVTYGTGGVGFWQHSMFGSVRHLVRLADGIRVRRYVLDNYPVRAHERRLVQERISTHRQEALVSALHLLRRRQENAFKEILYLLRDDPMCAATWCVALPKLMYRKIRRAPIARH
jgi:succinoglycan biosynthesis protein ExoW